MRTEVTLPRPPMMQPPSRKAGTIQYQTALSGTTDSPSSICQKPVRFCEAPTSAAATVAVSDGDAFRRYAAGWEARARQHSPADPGLKLKLKPSLRRQNLKQLSQRILLRLKLMHRLQEMRQKHKSKFVLQRQNRSRKQKQLRLLRRRKLRQQNMNLTRDNVRQNRIS